MMVTAHSNMFESSTSPAEKPSTGFLVRSAATATAAGKQLHRGTHAMQLAGCPWAARQCSPRNCFLSRLVA